MKNTVPDYYEKFVCIADRCPDTCCSGWEIVVDSASVEKYSAVSGSFGEKIRSVMQRDEDGDIIFKSENGRCPFLLESGLCEMFCTLGESSLCRTCTRFPRHTAYFGCRCETGLSLSCPEAARIIMNCEEPVKFITVETGDEIVPSDFDAELYLLLLKVREKIFNIIQSGAGGVEERFANALLLCKRLDGCIKNGDYSEAESITAGFSQEKLCGDFKLRNAKNALKKYISDLLETEALDESRKDILIFSEADGITYPDENELEKLAVYFIFRYLILAAYDGDLGGKIKFCAQAFAVLRAVCASRADKSERVRIMQIYSKEIEHSAENTALINSRIKKSRYYSYENLINILSSKEIYL